MDFLKAEIEKKRKSLESLGTSGGEPKKYIRRGDLEKQRQEAYYAEQQRRAQEKEDKLKKLQEEKEAEIAAKEKKKQERLASGAESQSTTKVTSDLSKIPPEEIVKRLRNRGLPVRLFGESDVERIKRLGLMESVEERSHGQRNDFNALLEANEEELAVQRHYGITSTQVSVNKPQTKQEEEVKRKIKDIDREDLDPSEISMELLKSDPDRLHQLIAVYFKRLQRDWERTLVDRSEEDKRSADGKRQLAICTQTSEYLKPFYKRLKKKVIDKDILDRITEICENLYKREYRKANDIYLRLSIGNAPWPIGVTNVSIHQRSAHERIDATKVGHVLNDEVDFVFDYLVQDSFVKKR